MNLSSIGHIRYEPGDIVEHTKTKEDFVIQSIGTAGVVGALVVTTIGLFNRKVRQFPTNPLFENLEFSLIRKNLTREAPQEVIDNVEKLVRNASATNRSVTKLLRGSSPEARLFRRLLLMGNDVSEAKFTKALSELAEGFVIGFEAIPSESEILGILKEALPEAQYAQEFLEDFSHSFVSFARSAASKLGIKATSLLTPEALQVAPAFLLDSNLQPTAKLARVLVKGNFAQVESLRPPSELRQKFFKTLFGRETRSRTVAGTDTFLSEFYRLTPEARVKSALEDIFHSQGLLAGSIINEQSNPRFISNAVKAAKEGISNPVLDFIAENAVGNLGQVFKLGAPYLEEDVSYGHGWARSSYDRGWRARDNKLKSVWRDRLDINHLSEMADIVVDHEGKTARQGIMITKGDLLTELIGKKIVTPIEGIREGVGDERTLAILSGNLPDQILTTPKAIREASIGESFDLSSIIKTDQELRSFFGEEDLSKEPLIKMMQLVNEEQFPTHPVFKFTFPSLPPSQETYGDLFNQLPEQMSISDKLLATFGHENIPGTDRYFMAKGHNILTKNIEEVNGVGKLQVVNLRKGTESYNSKQEELYDFLERNQAVVRPLIPEAITTQSLYTNDINNLRIALNTPGGIGGMRVKQKRPIKLTLNKGDARQGFDRGSRMGRIAIAQLKHPNETKLPGSVLPHNLTVLGSNIDVNIDEQLKRAYSYLEQPYGGALLDIETTPDGINTKIREIGLRKKVGKTLSSKGELNLTQISDEGDAIIQLANKLKTVRYLGTQSGYDLKTLITKAEQLILNEKSAVRKKQLIKALSVLNNTQQNSLFDIQLVLQLQGNPLGMSNQQDAMIRAAALGTYTGPLEQPHGAIGDITIAHELMMGGSVQKIEKILNNGDLLNENIVQYDFGTRSPNFGQHRQILGITPKFHADKLHIQLASREVGFDYEGKVSFLGKPEVELFSSSDVLGARLLNTVNINSPRYNPLIVQETTRDIAEREFRALNPFASTYFDTIGIYDRNTGPFAQVNHLTETAASRIYKNPKIQAMLPKATSLDFNYSDIEKFNLMEEEITGVIDKELGNYPLELQERIKQSVLARVKSPTLAAIKEEANIAKGRLGEILETLGTKAMENPIFSHTFTLGYAAAILTAKDNNFVRSITTNPRLSIRLGGQEVSADIRLGSTASVFENALDSLVAENIVELHRTGGKKSSQAVDLLQSLNYSDEQIANLRDMVKNYAETKGVTNPDNLYAYKKALEDIKYLPQDSEYHQLAVLHGRIKQSNQMRESLIEGFERASQEFTKRGGHKEFGSKLIETLKGRLNEFNDITIALRTTIGESIINDEETTTNFFRSEITNQLDIDALNTYLETPEGTEEYLDRLTKLGENVSDTDFNEAMAIAKGHIQDNFFAAEGIDRAALGPIALEQEILHRQGLEAAQIVGRTSKDDMQIFHELVARSKSVGTSDPFRRVMTMQEEATEGVIGAAAEKIKLSTPLMLAGGIITMLGLKNIKDSEFSSGKQSEKYPDIINKYSEIPGGGTPPAIFTGEANPFRLDITFKGVLDTRRAAEDIVEKVYSALSNTVQFRSVNSITRDKRRRDFKFMASDLLKRNL